MKGFVSVFKLLSALLVFAGCSAEDTQKINSASDQVVTNTAGEIVEKSQQLDESLSYVGSQQCKTCHSEEYELWQGSHHDLAMQPVNKDTVLGDFNNARFKYFDTESTFFKKEDQFYVKTDGPDGKLTDYPIAYVFGVYPLQQYLISFPNGRYQALNIAWDSRSEEEGGQRWFHLHPDEEIKHGDELHWTGINNNWNFMCADCHSTNLNKNYDVSSKTYNTTWSELDVACEACHGPASGHLAWTSNQEAGAENKGFGHVFNERNKVAWAINAESGNAKRSHSKDTNTEINVCAKCHSRRATQFSDVQPDDGLLNNHRVALLTESLYHADGQINDEVYVYGSFVQSKMFHAGVTCSDCHEPHSLKLRKDGNALCAQCHLSDKYDSDNHHLHKAQSEGSQCVNCHMASKNYMVIDARRDHSFRIPRPDLSAVLSVPNACNQCHDEKSPKWAADVLQAKFGKPEQKHYAMALYAGRNGLPQAEQLLTQLLLDTSQPAIARATAVTLLPRYLTQNSAPVLQQAAHDESGLVGLGLASVLENIPTQYRPVFAVPLLYDDSRVIRSLAANSLVGISLDHMPAESREKFASALKDYEVSQLFNADRPESLANLAGLYAKQGKPELAEQLYREAIAMAPYFVPAYVNLADYYRNIGKDGSGETVLKDALQKVTDKAAIQHAMGLLLVRQNKQDKAIEYLRQAAENMHSTDRYKFVYAIALNSAGKSREAINVLEQAQKEFPGNTDILQALASINRDIGDQDKAKYYESMFNVRQ